MLTHRDQLAPQEKRGLRANKNRNLVEALQIGLASPEDIRRWSERSLPDGTKVGKVSSPKTVDYKNLKPFKEGLFCERIFGPVKDFVCACGKKQNKMQVPRFCKECGVEATRSNVRRSRLGYIQLVSPVAHIWYLKGRISYIPILLGKKNKTIKRITDCTRFTVDYILAPVGMDETTPSAKGVEEDRHHISPPLIDTELCKVRLKDHGWKPPQTPIKELLPKVLNVKASRVKEPFSRIAGREPSSPGLNFNLPIKRRGERAPTSQPVEVWRTRSLVPRFDESGDTFFTDREPSISKRGVEWSPGRAGSRKYPLKGVRSRKERWLHNPLWGSGQNRHTFYPHLQKEEVLGWYSQSHVFPSLPTLTYHAQDRDVLLASFTQPPTCDDKPIPWYSAVSRDHQPVTLSQLLAKQPDDMPSWATERILRHTGGEALGNLIRRFDLLLLDRNLVYDLLELKILINGLLAIRYRVRSEDKALANLQKRQARQTRRLKVVRVLLSSTRKPYWMILYCLPVLPPDLRPIIRLDAGVVVASDLNKLYQRVLFRNTRVRRLRLVLPSLIGGYKMLLQQAVDALLAGGKGSSRALSAYHDKPLKSISDSLKGKRGRFRQNLLGKRVDYSGRAVIVVGPKLRLQECGLPREMAIKLFQPFLTRQLLIRGIVSASIFAKGLIASSPPMVWKVLSELMKNHPVLLNRAPTLHRLGVQAFQPRLTKGRALLLHPLVCTAFNADFDGDQMAVHIPLSFQSQAEAWKLMWSRNHLLSPATGQPIIAPTQDMVLGCYYLTSSISQGMQATQLAGGTRFDGWNDALRAYSQGFLPVHAPIWLDHEGEWESDHPPAPPVEVRVDKHGKQVEIYTGCQNQFNRLGERWRRSVRTTPGRLVFNCQAWLRPQQSWGS